jgi:hypothetical protein
VRCDQGEKAFRPCEALPIQMVAPEEGTVATRRLRGLQWTTVSAGQRSVW